MYLRVNELRFCCAGSPYLMSATLIQDRWSAYSFCFPGNINRDLYQLVVLIFGDGFGPDDDAKWMIMLSHCQLQFVSNFDYRRARSAFHSTDDFKFVCLILVRRILSILLCLSLFRDARHNWNIVHPRYLEKTVSIPHSANIRIYIRHVAKRFTKIKNHMHWQNTRRYQFIDEIM